MHRANVKQSCNCRSFPRCRQTGISSSYGNAIACGADGLIIECHPEPEKSVSDARQALSLEDMVDLVDNLRLIAAAVGRIIPQVGVGFKPAPIFCAA